jgi:hypothetical protein
MSTQIYISDNKCKPEYTKIVTHSFGFAPTLQSIDTVNKIFIGGQTNSIYSIWSDSFYDSVWSYNSGILGKNISSDVASSGIPIPINLVADDKITLNGTAFFNLAKNYINSGFMPRLLIGVYYFDCDITSDLGNRAYTFIPLTTADFDIYGNVCFSSEVTLASNFDYHQTRILFGFNIVLVGSGTPPDLPDEPIATVSYTLDIERPCPAVKDNFIIRNCCEPAITELVHIPSVAVGSFYVDNEGNCWEVISESDDVTNFTRTFVNDYTTCLECQTANPCPQNLKIESCCFIGQEYVTGSLPGLNVGDTFVDNYGLCWTVTSGTSEPITEESITVASIIAGGCTPCITANPCPNFYSISSCCTNLNAVVALQDVLNVGDSFVDTNGNCWQVKLIMQPQLPTMYGIIVDTVYTGAIDPVTNCDLCTTAKPCPSEYFITIRGCCDNDRIEVAQIPAQYMVFNEGMIFSDWWGVCWEVMSFDVTGIETYPIWNWSISFQAANYKDCKTCAMISSSGKCKTFYEVQNCNTGVISIFKMQNDLTIGQFYINQLDKECYEVLGYGYPTFAQSPTAFNAETKWPDFYTCEECIIGTPAQKVVELQSCCFGTIIAQIWGPWVNGVGSVQVVKVYNEVTSTWYFECFTLIGLSTGIPVNTQIWYTDSTSAYADCTDCTTAWPCP